MRVILASVSLTVVCVSGISIVPEAGGQAGMLDLHERLEPENHAALAPSGGNRRLLNFWNAVGDWFNGCPDGDEGDDCSVGCPCSGENTCEAWHHVCRGPGKEGDSCHATKPCGKGLTCEAGVHKCRAPGRWGDSCHLTRPCGNGLSCQPGVHKCYSSPRGFGEPCVAGYGCGPGLTCAPAAHICTIDGIPECDIAVASTGVTVGVPLAAVTTCALFPPACPGILKVGAGFTSSAAQAAATNYAACHEKAKEIHPNGLEGTVSPPAAEAARVLQLQSWARYEAEELQSWRFEPPEVFASFHG